MPAVVRRLATAGPVLVVTISIASLLGAAPARAATQSVQIGDGFFTPANLTIAVGDTVTWTNGDDSPHTVTAGGDAFASGTIESGSSFSRTFTSPGTYAYVCSFHDEMVGTITVKAAAAPAPAAPSAPAASAPADGAPSHDGDAHDSAAADTAVAASPALYAAIPPLLIGLGLVTLAFGLWPVAAPADQRPSPGRRRWS
ncbi:MAG TPA: cupredoxin family copper-binding protein [Candidatus Limnocylindria bacterium]|nr:cupredoxin family copper-binding protein [Candidatus Limnocylindria bacterium]